MQFCSQIRKSRNLVCPKIRWWRLKEGVHDTFTDKVVKHSKCDSERDSNVMWSKMTTCIKNVAKEVLGESRGTRHDLKKTWWWGEEIQKSIKHKKVCFKTWQRIKEDEDRNKYYSSRKEARILVKKAKTKKYDEFYSNLNTKAGGKAIYKLAKLRDMKNKDLEHVRCIKDEGGRMLVKDVDIMTRWSDYFSKLLNGDNLSGSYPIECPSHRDNTRHRYVRRIGVSEVKEALTKMKSGKTASPDDVPIEIWKSLGLSGVPWLTNLFNKIMSTRKMPDEWRRSFVNPIYKNK
ncbi:uncharacterized protein LOC122067642 [Macadamia integrifolia]|uniref:uncharacterized protein LOC122067642 n=1 Tax=Macadamia integrifolia TaxID=60698 RepID=UPI001C4F8205|nr:uncharacterized protein LOC122067642 [Macadamia integrifolia]